MDTSFNEIILSNVITTEDNGKFKITVESNLNTEDIWYEFDSKYKELVGENVAIDAFVIPYLLIGMFQGRNLNISSDLSQFLYFGLYDLQSCILAVSPQLQRIEIKASKLIKRSFTGNAVATGFSGGVDSFFTVLNYRENEALENNSIDYLLFNNAGQHGEYSNALKTFNSRLEIANNGAKELKIPLISIDSNIDELIPINFISSHSLRNISFGLLFQKTFKYYLYSSGYSLNYEGERKSGDIAVFDSMILPLLSTESFRTLTYGTSFSRAKKLDLIQKHPEVFDNLYVCTEKLIPARNCNICFKCKRTLVSLDSLDSVKNYKKTFDVDFYYRNREQYLTYITAYQSDIPVKEVLSDFLKYKKIPSKIYFKGFIVRCLMNYSPKSIQWRLKKHFPIYFC